MKSVKVSNLSLSASDMDIGELLAYSGHNRHIELKRLELLHSNYHDSFLIGVSFCSSLYHNTLYFVGHEQWYQCQRHGLDYSESAMPFESIHKYKLVKYNKT